MSQESIKKRKGEIRERGKGGGGEGRGRSSPRPSVGQIGGIQEMTGWGYHYTTGAECHPEVMGVCEASGLET